MSMPRSRASRLASGEALMRPLLVVGAGGAVGRRCQTPFWCLTPLRAAARPAAPTRRPLPQPLRCTRSSARPAPRPRRARSSAAPPRSRDSTSCVTLSVSTSKSGSPFATASPSFFSHFVTVPDSIPWPSRGSLTSEAIAYFPTVRLIAASTSSACGTTYCSITGANASGTNFAPTRSIGASR